MKLIGIIGIIVMAVILLGRGLVLAYEEATPQELKDKITKGSQGLIILDVRENDEVANCRIPKSVHIPLADVSTRLKELDPEKEIVVYCAAGVRSARASKILDGAGFKKVKNLKGGIRNWMAAGGVVEGPCK
ncbi:MAG: rhodanese-like domain-containing protein [Deltaproteobacteria bacterium]|nr:rhodanese-like domain-containing protein [Deltaproteobacteria bacterium]